MKKLLSMAAVGFLLTALVLAVAPAWAQNVDSRIQALENELARLKGEQIELKKQAVTAAEALPTFSYRPGAGVTITAADQSWAIKFGYENAVDMLWLAGQDAVRAGDFELFGRRNRPAFYYYWDKGFYEFKLELDMDSSETGTKETLIQRQAVLIHFEQMNPWYPTLQFGQDISGAGSRYRQSDLTFELPLLDRNNGFNTGSFTGMGFQWADLPSAGLFPGTWDFHYNWVIHGMGRSDGLFDQSNNNDHTLYFNVNPFSTSKNKWLEGVGYSMFAWFGSPDTRNTTNSTRRIQIRTQEGPNRVTLFDTANDIGSGLHTFLAPSIRYKVGPYQLQVVGGFDRYNTNKGNRVTGASEVGRIEGSYFKFMNDLMLWSPKGLLTGSSTTPNSLGIGWSFERTDVSCGRPLCDETVTAGGAQFARNRILIRELDLRYWIRPSLSVWWTWKWHDVSNVPTTSQDDIKCSRNNALTVGKGCDWSDFALRWFWTF